MPREITELQLAEDSASTDLGRCRLFSPLRIWSAVRPRIEASSSSTM